MSQFSQDLGFNFWGKKFFRVLNFLDLKIFWKIFRVEEFKIKIFFRAKEFFTIT